MTISRTTLRNDDKNNSRLGKKKRFVGKFRDENGEIFRIRVRKGGEGRRKVGLGNLVVRLFFYCRCGFFFLFYSFFFFLFFYTGGQREKCPRILSEKSERVKRVGLAAFCDAFSWLLALTRRHSKKKRGFIIPGTDTFHGNWPSMREYRPRHLGYPLSRLYPCLLIFPATFVPTSPSVCLRVNPSS